jgi:hypothetical protein
MDYNKINIEIEIKNNEAKISTDIAGARYYNLDRWALGAAVHNYIEDEILCEED